MRLETIERINMSNINPTVITVEPCHGAHSKAYALGDIIKDLDRNRIFKVVDITEKGITIVDLDSNTDKSKWFPIY